MDTSSDTPDSSIPFDVNDVHAVLGNLTMKLTSDNRRQRNGLFFSFADTTAAVTYLNEQGDRVEVGEVVGVVGGGVELRDKATGQHWYISPLDLWCAFDAFKQSPLYAQINAQIDAAIKVSK